MAMTVFFKKFIHGENFLFELKTLLHANPKIKWKESFPFATQSWVPNPHHPTRSKPCKASHVAQGWRSPGGNYPADAGVGTLNSPKSNDIKVSSIFNNVSQSKNLNMIFHGGKKKQNQKNIVAVLVAVTSLCSSCVLRAHWHLWNLGQSARKKAVLLTKYSTWDIFVILFQKEKDFSKQAW